MIGFCLVRGFVCCGDSVGVGIAGCTDLGQWWCLWVGWQMNKRNEKCFESSRRFGVMLEC